eukprot:2599037-Pyramimonas_sp.AAC.2
MLRFGCNSLPPAQPSDRELQRGGGDRPILEHLSGREGVVAVLVVDVVGPPSHHRSQFFAYASVESLCFTG